MSKEDEYLRHLVQIKRNNEYHSFVDKANKSFSLLNDAAKNGKTQLEITRILDYDQCQILRGFVTRIQSEKIFPVQIHYDNGEHWEYSSIRKPCRIGFSWL